MKGRYVPVAVEHPPLRAQSFQGGISTLSTGFDGYVEVRYAPENGGWEALRGLVGAIPFPARIAQGGPFLTRSEAMEWAEDRVCELEAEAELRAAGAPEAADLCRGVLTADLPRDPLYKLMKP